LMARWLVDQGVRHLVLIGRSAPNREAQQTIEELTAQGAQIMPLSADVSKRDDVAWVLAEIEQNLPPLSGIIHLAAAIDNGILIKLNHEQIRRVLAPKIIGTWHLHSLTQHMALDCFVGFSSIAAFGISGQGNYNAANLFIDSLMHYRHALGLPATAVNWGAWDESGRALEMLQFMGSLGLELMSPAKSFATLNTLLGLGTVEALVADVDWEAYQQYYATNRQRRFVDEIYQAGSSTSTANSETSSFADLLAATAPEEQRSLILNTIRAEAGYVLGFNDVEALDTKRGFFTLGMDSLMSVQLRNRLENKLGCNLPPTVAFEYPTIEALANYVADAVFKIAKNEPELAATQPETKEDSSLDLNDFSQDDLMSLLDDELRNINKLIGDN
jgi:myxalamid-type polyketide synthase MxaC